jgi:phosphate transport system ATP-binding protein
MQQAARVSDIATFFNLGKLLDVEESDSFFTRPKLKPKEDYIIGRFG